MSHNPEIPPRPEYGSDPHGNGGPYGEPQHGGPRPGGQGKWQQGQWQQGAYDRPSGPADDERTVAILTHLAGPIAALISAGWLGFLGPLIVWFIYKDKSPFLRTAAAGAFNFNVTLWLVNVAGWILIATVIGIPLGIILIIAYWVALLVCHIKAAMRSSRGEVYRYPWQLPILR